MHGRARRTHGLGHARTPRTQERKNIEGTLFLVKRRTLPRFQIIVLNKLATGGGRWEGRPPAHARAA